MDGDDDEEGKVRMGSDDDHDKMRIMMMKMIVTMRRIGMRRKLRTIMRMMDKRR